MSPQRKASTSAPPRKGNTSDAPVKQTSRVVAKSKETASKAQDDTICPECELLVDEDSKAIAFDVCSKWFHTTCQNISDALYTVLTSEETANVSWYCNYCTRGAGTATTAPGGLALQLLHQGGAGTATTAPGGLALQLLHQGERGGQKHDA